MKIMVGIKKIDKKVEFLELDNSLESMQDIVGGDIETVRMFDGVCMVVNGEGRLLMLEPNFAIYNGSNSSDILGDVFFCKYSMEEDLSVSDMEKIEEMFLSVPCEDEKKYYIFTYGTLKKGYSNHRLLKNAEFVCEASLKGYGIFNVYNGNFPGINKSENRDVYGEVYKVSYDELVRVNLLEGYRGDKNTDMYNRPMVSVKNLRTDKNMDVYVYEWNRKRENPYIDGGEWIK